MPTFRVKNLSVTLGEAAQAAHVQQMGQYCLFPTPCHHASHCVGPTFPCHWPTDQCQFPTIITCWTNTGPCLHGTCGIFSPDPCGPLTNPGTCGLNWSTLPPTTLRNIETYIKVLNNPDVLDMLRGQLEVAMEAVKERGIQLETGAGPQTMAEAELLEKELKEALAEVQNIKKKMK